MPRGVIVHPTDLKPASEAAFYHALKLGLAAHGHLSLVHFHDYTAEEVPELDSFPHVRETLTRWGLLPKGAPQSAVSEKLDLYLSKGEVLAADTEAGLVKLLHDENAELIVLGTRGLQGLERLSDSSFSEAVLRDARLPALIVPSGAKGFVDGHDGRVKLNNVLVPVDDDPDPAAAVAAAVRLCRLLGQDAQLHVLHVGRAGSMPPIKAPSSRLFHEIERQGHVVDTIVEVAEELDADLIVMATAGHKGLMDALRGSTTEGVLRRAHRAVLAVPAVEEAAHAVASQGVDEAAPGPH